MIFARRGKLGTHGIQHGLWPVFGRQRPGVHIVRRQAIAAGALALFCCAVFADCREASGARFQGLTSPVVWHARAACGESTLIWFQSIVGKDGATPVWRVDDLLVVPALEKDQALSLLSPLDVDCRHLSDRQSLVIAVGAWSGRAARGERQRVDRAWRVDAESKKVSEVPIRDVACVLR